MASETDIKPVPIPEFGKVEATELDEALYELDDAETEFMSQQTGIENPEELKKYLIQIQRKAYAVYPYPCIKVFSFAKFKIARLPIYNQLIKLGKERPGAIFLDVGCGVGNDIRKLIADGFPASQIVAVDLKSDFWELGHEVFKSTPETLSVRFIAGNVFDKSFLEPGPIPTETPQLQGPVDLSSLTSLTPLRGRLSAIYASCFFHLFSEEQQMELAYLLGSLLSPEPGSIIFGTHVSLPEKGIHIAEMAPERYVKTFNHSPESWTALWDEVFAPGKVEAKAFLQEYTEVRFLAGGEVTYFLVWFVKRL